MKLLTIGTSMITHRFLEAVKLVSGVSHVAAYSRDLEKTKVFDQVVGFDNLDEALNSSLIDTVYIASPNTLHYPQAKAALLAGKHVICEKPFVSTVEQLEELSGIAKEKNLFLFEAITTLHLPNYQIIKDNLHKVGQVKIINCNYSQYSSRYTQYLNHEVTNIFDPKFDGGAMRDINIYNLHFVMGLFGIPNNYKYYANRGFNQVDTSGILMLEYDDFHAVLIGSKDSSSESYGLIQGELGTIKVSDSSLGRCEKITFSTHIMDNQNQESSTIISIKQDMHMSYELSTFKEIIDQRDYDRRDQLLHHSLEVMKILEVVSQYEK